MLCATDALQTEKQHLEDELSMVVAMTQDIVAENARIAQDQEEYKKHYDRLVQRYNDAKARHAAVTKAIAEKEAKNVRLTEFIAQLKAQNDTISEFDLSLWSSTVEFVTVSRNKKITVTFRDGTEIKT